MANITLQSVFIDFPIYGISSQSLKKQLNKWSTGGKVKTDSDIINIKALSDISLKIHHGDRLGIVGSNGSGKSTLLRVIAKIYEPTQGKITVNGRVSALLDVMLGMNPDATGYENILLRGLINGFSYQETKKKQNEIVEFTELGNYISLPVRTYSAGMQLRLAFGIATAILPEILLLDEIVGVGDLVFFNKAKIRLNEMINQSHIVVLTSHDLDIIEKFCNKILWLDKGQIIFMGEMKEGLKKYRRRKIKT